MRFKMKKDEVMTIRLTRDQLKVVDLLKDKYGIGYTEFFRSLVESLIWDLQEDNQITLEQAKEYSSSF